VKTASEMTYTVSGGAY